MKKGRGDAGCPTYCMLLNYSTGDVRLKIQDGLETETRGDDGLYSFIHLCRRHLRGRVGLTVRNSEDSALRRNGFTVLDIPTLSEATPSSIFSK